MESGRDAGIGPVTSCIILEVLFLQNKSLQFILGYDEPSSFGLQTGLICFTRQFRIIIFLYLKVNYQKLTIVN